MKRLFALISIPILTITLVSLQYVDKYDYVSVEVTSVRNPIRKQLKKKVTDEPSYPLAEWKGNVDGIGINGTAYRPRTAITRRSNSKAECVSNEEIYPGTLVGSDFPLWEPAMCQIHHYTPAQIDVCLSSKKIVAMGDSLLRSITFELPVTNKTVHGNGWRRTIDYEPNSLKDVGLEYFGMASFNKHMEKETSHFHTTDTLEKAIQAADVLLLSAGTWDMGRDFDGVWEFYRRVSRRLFRLGMMKRPSAGIYIMAPHWIHFDQCFKLCKACNTPKKVVLFREVVQMAASCQNVSMIDFTKITQNYSHLSREITSDGLHYFRQYADVEADVLLNVVCREKPMLPLKPVTCLPDETLRKMWQHEPPGVFGCYGRSVKEIRREKRTKIARQRFMKEVLPFT